MTFICRLVGHQRSAKRAKFDFEAQLWRSQCRLCGAPMARDEGGGWHSAAAG